MSCGQWVGVTFRWCLHYKHNGQAHGVYNACRVPSPVATGCKDVNNSLCDETNRLVWELTIGHTQTHTDTQTQTHINTNRHSTHNLSVSEQGVRSFTSSKGPVMCLCTTLHHGNLHQPHHHQETQTQRRQKHARKAIRSWGYTRQKNSSDLLKWTASLAMIAQESIN